MADPTKVATGLADLAVKVQEKADQAESNQATCKILAGHIRAVVPVIMDLEDKICEEDERLQDFVDDMGSLLLETDRLIDKISSRNMATKLLKASSDERELTAIKERLAQMSQRATFQILTIVTEIKTMISGEGAKPKKKKTFRPIELKLQSKQDVDRPFDPAEVLMRATGEIVCLRLVEKEGDIFLQLYTLQGESRDKKNIKLPRDFGHRFALQFLFVQILWREYLAISCMYCKDIKLLDMETLEVTTAFSDDQQLGKMCRGWHKLFVEVPSGCLELDCSSTKFTKIREIETEELILPYRSHICYIPPPHNIIVTAAWEDLKKGGRILATSLDEPNKTMWRLYDKKVDGKIISPRCVVYSSRHDALIVLDREKPIIWVLHPSTGKVVQNMDVVDHPWKVFLRGSQLVIVSIDEIHHFSIG